MQVHPIRDEADLEEAVRAIERLWGAEAGTEDAVTLEVLGILVDLYERTHHPIGPPEPIAAITFRMEQMGLSRKDLEPYIGSRGRVHEILTGQRKLTR
jgi:HTH-type transcriptional regulator/antitoxin HigA